MSLKSTIQTDMKTALKQGEKFRLSVIRMLLAAIQTREIDERRELNNTELLAVVEKQIKQRRDSASQYADAGRKESEEQELKEAEILNSYLPEPLDEAALNALIEEVVAATGATSLKDMGKVMAAIRDQAQGRADMGAISAKIKARLAS